MQCNMIKTEDNICDLYINQQLDVWAGSDMVYSRIMYGNNILPMNNFVRFFLRHTTVYATLQDNSFN